MVGVRVLLLLSVEVHALLMLFVGAHSISMLFVFIYVYLARQISETIVHIVVQAPKLT
jgi:hypothetical protein